MLFQTGSSLPYAQLNLTGSVMGLALTHGGKWVAVARKSTHANIAACGGSLELFSAESQDVQVLGPSSPVQRLRNGDDPAVAATQGVARDMDGDLPQMRATPCGMVPQGAASGATPRGHTELQSSDRQARGRGTITGCRR